MMSLSKAAIQVLHAAVERYGVHLLYRSNVFARHRRCHTVMLRDLALALQMEQGQGSECDVIGGTSHRT